MGLIWRLNKTTRRKVLKWHPIERKGSVNVILIRTKSNFCWGHGSMIDSWLASLQLITRERDKLHETAVFRRWTTGTQNLGSREAKTHSVSSLISLAFRAAVQGGGCKEITAASLKWRDRHRLEFGEVEATGICGTRYPRKRKYAEKGLYRHSQGPFEPLAKYQTTQTGHIKQFTRETKSTRNLQTEQ